MNAPNSIGTQVMTEKNTIICNNIEHKFQSESTKRLLNILMAIWIEREYSDTICNVERDLKDLPYPYNECLGRFVDKIGGIVNEHTGGIRLYYLQPFTIFSRFIIRKCSYELISLGLVFERFENYIELLPNKDSGVYEQYKKRYKNKVINISNVNGKSFVIAKKAAA